MWLMGCVVTPFKPLSTGLRKPFTTYSPYFFMQLWGSLVCGPDKSYLWILARGPEIEEGLKDIFIAKAAASGFDTSKLIFVDHD